MENKDKVKNKKGNGSLIAIFILILIVLGLVLYIAYDKGIIFSKTTDIEENNVKKNNTTNEKSKSSEDIALDDSRFINIYKKLAKFTYETNRENGYNSFLDKDLATIAIGEFTTKDFEKTSENDYYTYKYSTMTDKLKEYFSDNVSMNKNKILDMYTIAKENIENQGNTIYIESYDKSSDSYKVKIANGDRGWTQAPEAKITARKIVSAKLNNDEIIVTEKVIYYTVNYNGDNCYYNIYSDPQEQYYLDGKKFNVSTVANEEINVDDYSEKASTITHIFKLNNNTNKYYFASSVIK